MSCPQKPEDEEKNVQATEEPQEVLTCKNRELTPQLIAQIEADPFEHVNFYFLYKCMDREDKSDFQVEVMSKLHCSLTTFYNRIRDQYPWTVLERNAIKNIIIKYRKKYAL